MKKKNLHTLAGWLRGRTEFISDGLLSRELSRFWLESVLIEVNNPPRLKPERNLSICNEKINQKKM